MFRRFEVADRSMSPALEPGDYLIARSDSNPRRGDLVVFQHPGRTGFWLVKRLVGLPGENLTITGGEVQVDGSPLDDPWATGPTEPPGEWRLRPDEAFVLSDARPFTRADSRSLGPIALESLHRVAFRYWPPGRIGYLRWRR